MPMQKPQAVSQIRAPASIMSCSAPFCAEHAQHLPAAGRDDQRHIGIHGLALQDGRHAHHILIAGIGAGADAHLIHLDGARPPGRFSRCRAYGAEPPWAPAWTGRCPLLHHISRRGRQPGADSLPRGSCAFRKRRAASSLGNTEVVAPSSAPILAMVARSGIVRLSTPSPGVFHHLAHAALDGQAAQQLQNHVLCGHTPGAASQSGER